MSKSTKILLFLLDNLIWVMLLILVAINVIVTPHFAEFGNIINILDASAILGVLVLAQGICLMSGHFDLSTESTLAFAPVIAVLIAKNWFPEIGFGSAIAVTLIIGCIVGIFNGFCVAYLKVNAFLQTLSMQIVLRGMTLFLIPITIYGLPPVYTFLGGGRLFGKIPMEVIVFVAAFILFEVVIKRLKFGRFLLATGGNRKTAYVSGINVQKIIFLTFMLSGILAALAGLLAAGRQGGVTNSMGQNMVMLSFAGAVLGGVSLQGGIGSSLGMFGGVLFLGVIDNCLILLGTNVYIIYCVKGLLILVAVVLDQAKVTTKNYLLRREEIKKFDKLEKTKKTAAVQS
ncbi:MAG: ABC transporter permease [Deltaproteobacteria bacterium]|nr:ABC transporter permease [Deltaproteobacteria bacterium]